MPSPYNWRWRTVTRPAILARENGRCLRCGTRQGWLDVAHLVLPPGEPGHDDLDNLGLLCRKCHRRHDYAVWARKCWLTRTRRKDSARPLLTLE